MKSILTILILFVLSNSVFAQENEEELIRRNFDSYRTFIYNGNGEEAVNLVDNHTISYYGDIIELVKNADSLKVESLSILDKMMVLLVRQRVSNANILKFDGTDLLIYAINNGMIDKSNAMSFTIGDIEVDDDFAKGQLIANGIESPYFLHFYKEKERWKYDLKSSFPVGIPAIEKLTKELGEKELIDLMLRSDTVSNPNPNIWRQIK